MEFKTIEPYLPVPVLALKQVVWDKQKLSLFGKKEVLETALAVTGYFLAIKHAGYIGLNYLEVAALTSLVSPNIPRFAIGGHCVFYGIKGAIDAHRANNIAGLVKNVALVTLGYFGTTTQITTLLRNYVYNKL